MEGIDSDEGRRGVFRERQREKERMVDGEGVKECAMEKVSMEFLSVAFFGSSLLPYFSGLLGEGRKLLCGKTA